MPGGRSGEGGGGARRLSGALAAAALGALTACGGAGEVASARGASSVAHRSSRTPPPVAAETFARARAEGRLVLLEGGASWCRFCVAMENTTYQDPAVRAVIDERFIPVKVDIEARPDIEERYAAYGWPATVIFDPDAREIGRYKGYIPPAEFAALLREVASQAPRGGSALVAARGP